MHTSRLAALGMLFLIGSLMLSACSSPALSQTAQTMKMPDFVQSAAPDVQTAYQFAVSNPHALETVPCYCGCGKMGHKSNLDCYVKAVDSVGNVTFDSHAAYCGICANITNDVIRLQKEGKLPHEIRAYVDAQYSSYGPSTDTVQPVD